MTEPRSSLYRANVGVALFNHAGFVLIARRFRDDGPEIIQSGFEWQMPQGGMDPGEEALPAARRELFEETGVSSADYLGEVAEWLSYDFPAYAGNHRLAAYRGQRQKWFALRFTGNEAEIDVTTPRGGVAPEFDTWRWEKLEKVPGLVVPFKQHIYRRVAEDFAPFAKG